MNVDIMISYGGIILTGLKATVELTIYSFVLALAVATVAGVALQSKIAVVRWVTRVYVEVFRGTSVFVQLFAAYFLLPLSGFSLTPMQAGILALGLNAGAYGAEIVRAAIVSIGRDQVEASIALNLSRSQALRHVIFPQALVSMLPSFGNLATEIMKGTALASLISVTELTMQAQMVRSQTGETAFPFTLIFFTYLIVASCILWVVKVVERRYSRGLDTRIKN